MPLKRTVEMQKIKNLNIHLYKKKSSRKIKNVYYLIKIRISVYFPYNHNFSF